MKNSLQFFLALFFLVPLTCYGKVNIEPFDGSIHAPIGLTNEGVNLRTGKVQQRSVDLVVPGNGGLNIEVSRSYLKNGLTNYGIPHSIGNWELEIPKITGIVGQSNYCGNPTPSAFRVTYKPVLLKALVSVSPSQWSNAASWGSIDITKTDLDYGIRFTETIRKYDHRWGTQSFYIEKNYTANPKSISREFLGLTLSIPDENVKDLLKSDAGSVGVGNEYITTDYWKSTCITKDGISKSGFLVTSPNGTHYTFDKSFISKTRYKEVWQWAPRALPVDTGENIRNLIQYYPSKIEDKYGNILKYTYFSDPNGTLHVSKIESNHAVSDPLYRSVNFRYYPARNVAWSASGVSLLKEVESNGKIWQYKYDANGLLQQVIQPDLGVWKYTYDNAFYNERLFPKILSVTNPSNGKIVYSYQSKPANHFGGPRILDPVPNISVIQSRTISGPNIVTGKTQYNFDIAGETRIGTEDSLQVIKFHLPNDALYGTVESYQIYDSIQNLSANINLASIALTSLNILQDTTNTWQVLPKIGDTAVLNRPIAMTTPKVLASSTITRDGSGYKTTYSNFDSFGNATSVKESSPSFSRDTNFTYINNTVDWILHQKENQTIVGIGSILRTFYPLGNIKTLNKYGVTTRFTYHPDGELHTITDPIGNITRYTNYKRGKAQTETQAENTPVALTIIRVVNPSGLVESETIDGKTTSYLFDNMNRLASVTMPLANSFKTTIDYAYSINGFTQTTVRGTFLQSKEYNGFGKLKITNAEGIIQKIDYDTQQRKSVQYYPNSGLSDTYKYDALGRVKSITHSGDGTSINYNYLTGNKVKINNERGLDTTYTYRSYGNPDDKSLIQIDAPEAIKTIITRDALGNIQAIEQDGRTRNYRYDSRYFLDTITDSETGVTDVYYDDAGNLKTKQVGTSGITTFIYDELNRLDLVDYPSTTPDVTYKYYPNGQLKSLSKGNSVWAYTYDDNQNLIEENLLLNATNYPIKYGYDQKDTLSNITYPSGLFLDFAPDDLGRASKVGTYLTSVDYHPNGQVNSMTFGNGVTTNISQSNRLFPTDLTITSLNASLVNRQYRYDGVGNVEAIDDNINFNNNLLLGYDGINRLTTMAGINVISYESTGNIKTKNINSLNLSYNYEPTTNRLASVTSGGAPWYSMQYDTYGNVTSNGVDNFVYDDASQLISVPNKNLQYEYDGNGMRYSVIDGTKTKYSLYSKSGLLVYEVIPATGETTEYIYLGSKLIAKHEQCSDLDTDKDLIPDCIEIRLGLNPNDPSDALLDADSDGLNNVYEYQIGSNMFAKDTDGDGMDDGYEDRYGLNLRVNDAALDPDGDGLTNLAEFTLGSNPKNSDTDGDGMNDGYEATYSLNILVDDSALDADADSLTNLEEFRLGSNPINSDTDGDGLPDGYEVRYGLDILNDDSAIDTDNDGLTNLQEFSLGTNPLDPDTDNDGVNDGDEVAAGTDPLLNLPAVLIILDLILD